MARYTENDYVCDLPYEIVEQMKERITRKFLSLHVYSKKELYIDMNRILSQEMWTLNDAINVNYWLKKANEFAKGKRNVKSYAEAMRW